MDQLRLTIEKVFKGAGKSFYRFPAAIMSAIIISMVAIVRISMEWSVKSSYTLLFDSIQIAFVLGAVFSMAAVVLDEVEGERKKASFMAANIAGLVAAAISFLLLYFFGGNVSEGTNIYLSSIATARAGVAIFISAVAFIIIISKAKYVESFSDSFFISQRAFFVAAIYGLVIMIGVSGVLGAFQALVYRNMGYKVYQYLGVAVGFLSYSMFLGYFPSFREGEDEIPVKNTKEQPRFIFVLLDYILTPIMMALTVVLLIWSLRVVLRSAHVSFNALSGIASSYVIIGIWLHIMVAKHETKIAGFYKKTYPIAAVLILIFEAWALFTQLSKFGLKTSEYSFLMIWIFAIVSVVFLLLLKKEAYTKIALTGVVVAIIWVLPIIGYQDITFNSQVKRLEKILVDQAILLEDTLMPTQAEVDQETRGKITDAVDFISYSDKTNKPSWFKKDLNDGKVFKEAFGFDKTYGLYPEESDYKSVNFRLMSGTVDIRDYSLSINMSERGMRDDLSSFEGPGGSYTIRVDEEGTRIPKITVKLEDRIIIEENMEGYLLDLISKYPSGDEHGVELPLEEMSMMVEGEGVRLFLVFDNINVYTNNIKQESDYYVSFQGIYVSYE